MLRSGPPPYGQPDRKISVFFDDFPNKPIKTTNVQGKWLNKKVFYPLERREYS